MAFVLAGIAGGLVLFLAGMRLMTRGLEEAAGADLRRVLERVIGVPIQGLVAGAALTAVVQSSSAVSLMVIGLIDAGLVTLREGVGVILGANIGTTVTVQLISFRLEELALPAAAAGLGLLLAAPRRRWRALGLALIGFGLLFAGMDVMSRASVPMQGMPRAAGVLAGMGRYPLLGVFAGAAFTGVIQSSSAAIGLAISLAESGLLDLRGAIGIVLGANIGTCGTAILGALGAGLAARRLAAAHVLLNVIGVAATLLILEPFVDLAAGTAAGVGHQIANAHTMFNIFNTIIILPVFDPFVNLSRRLVRGGSR